MNTTQSASAPYARLWQILVCIFAGYLLIAGKTVFCPLVFSMLFSILLLPIAGFLQRTWHFHRMAAAAVSVITLVIVVTGVVGVLVWQINGMATAMPQFKQRLPVLFKQVQQWSVAHFNIDVTGQLANINAAVTKIIQPSVIGTTLISLSSILIFIAFVVFDTLFILFYRALLMNFILAVSKKENTQVVHAITEKIKSVIGRYLRGLMLEVTIVSLTCSTAFWMAGIKYPLLMGLITGVFNIIPYAGIFTALLLNVLITFAMATTGKVVAVIIIVVAMHLIDSNLLLPFIVGAQVRINALVTILGLGLGALAWQIPGMFLSIPVLAVCKIVFDRVDGLKPFGLLLGDGNNKVGTGPA